MAWRIISYKTCPGYINPFWSSDTLWQQRSGSTLAQEMCCCLTAPNHYLNKYWFIINKIIWYSFQGDAHLNMQDINHQVVLEMYTFRITATSSWGQWVKKYEAVISMLMTATKQYHHMHQSGNIVTDRNVIEYCPIIIFFPKCSQQIPHISPMWVSSMHEIYILPLQCLCYTQKNRAPIQYKDVLPV